jgi:hypothetical protein
MGKSQSHGSLQSVVVDAVDFAAIKKRGVMEFPAAHCLISLLDCYQTKI